MSAEDGEGAELDGAALPEGSSLPVPSLEVPMEPVPEVIVPRQELAVRVAAPLPVEPDPQPTLLVEDDATLVVDEDATFTVEEGVVVVVEHDATAVDTALPLVQAPPSVPESAPAVAAEPELPLFDQDVSTISEQHGEAGPGALRPKTPEPAPPVVTRPMRELDRRRPIRAAFGLVALMALAASGLALAIGLAIAVIALALRKTVGG